MRGAEGGGCQGASRGGKQEEGQNIGANNTRQDELFTNKEIRQKFLSR